jgi:cobalt/nickel transport system permease protein
MHIPDGFLDAKTVVATAAISTVGVSLAIRHVRRSLPTRNVPMIGLSAAFAFAAQMLNFPIAGGTSGHLVGATLIASLLGLSSAIVALTAILVLQCFLFADGGVTSLGANVLNMAIVGSLVGYGVYRFMCRISSNSRRGRLTGVAFGAWCSTVVASLVCAGELASSGIADGRVAFPAMAGFHALIGIGEAAITALVFGGITRLRPELLEVEIKEPSRASARRTEFVVFGLLSAVALATFVAPFASPLPDGLESVAESLGFARHGHTVIPSPVPDYAFPGVSASGLATAIAGFVGTAIAFGFAYGLARLLTRRRISDKA